MGSTFERYQPRQQGCWIELPQHRLHVGQAARDGMKGGDVACVRAVSVAS